MKQRYIQLTKKISISALMLALGMLLPFLTGQIPTIGSMLLPMHIPVLLCGFICGCQYGAVVGFILPLLRGIVFGMPPIYPKGIPMAFELCAYGAIIGLVFKLLPKKGLLSIYISLISSMLVGRIIWAAASITTLGLTGKSFTFTMFLTDAFVKAFPGILLQLILIPSIMIILSRTRLVKFDDKNNTLL